MGQVYSVWGLYMSWAESGENCSWNLKFRNNTSAITFEELLHYQWNFPKKMLALQFNSIFSLNTLICVPGTDVTSEAYDITSPTHRLTPPPQQHHILEGPIQSSYQLPSFKCLLQQSTIKMVRWNFNLLWIIHFGTYFFFVSKPFWTILKVMFNNHLIRHFLITLSWINKQFTLKRTE